jgi:hypothetical protein
VYRRPTDEGSKFNAQRPSDESGISLHFGRPGRAVTTLVRPLPSRNRVTAGFL